VAIEVLVPDALRLVWPMRPGAFALAPRLIGSEIVRTGGALNARECDDVVSLGDSLPLKWGHTNAPSYKRRGRIAWIHPEADTAWLYQRLADLLWKIGARFGFDLCGFAEPLQYCVYEQGDHIDWHVDLIHVNGVFRKLSVTIQLSDPNSYEGGALEFAQIGGELVDARARGMAVVFPSFAAHRVTPVTKGQRCSLVAWASGPPFV